VIEAGDGGEALELVRQQAPSVVLTDLNMPRMDGLELVKAMRDDYPQVPVVLMTAFGSEDIAMQALRAGASHYIPKRSLATELPATLRRVMDVAALNKRRSRAIKHLQAREARFEFGNDPDFVDPLIELLLEDLIAMDACDSTARIQIGVALLEALTNALYHGNLEVSSELRQQDDRLFHDLAEQRRNLAPYSDRHIEVRARVNRHEACFTIQDEGPGFDTSLVDRPLEPEDLLRIGGRGLLVIRAYMDEVRFNAAGNRITIVKKTRPTA
jgi:CheY-like chemotaxis protein